MEDPNDKPRVRHFDDVTDEEWAQVFATPRGQRFRNNLAMMFANAPPFFAPAEADYKTYFFQLRDFHRKRWMVKTDVPGRLEEIDGLELLIRAFERAGLVADKNRPSVGSVRAHADRLIADAPLASRSIAAKPYTPPTAEQWAELAAIKRRIMGRFDIENLDSKDTERKGA